MTKKFDNKGLSLIELIVAIAIMAILVGVSFSENGYTVEAERKADMALNSVKENGRGTCKISL